MSTRFGPSSSYPASKELIESLEQPLKMVDLTKNLMELPERDARKLIGYTSKTGFRRIHEYLTSVIDRGLELISRDKDKLNDERLNELLVMFARSLILVEYQEARDQLDRELANRIKIMVEHAIDVLKTKNIERIKRTLESMRTIMDAILVLAYKYAR